MMVEVMKIMVTSFKRFYASTATFSALSPSTGHLWPTPPLETPGHSQASLGQSLVGSLLLSPGSWCTRLRLCPPSLFPSLVQVLAALWLMATSSKRAYTIPKSLKTIKSSDIEINKNLKCNQNLFSISLLFEWLKKKNLQKFKRKWFIDVDDQIWAFKENCHYKFWLVVSSL